MRGPAEIDKAVRAAGYNISHVRIDGDGNAIPEFPPLPGLPKQPDDDASQEEKDAWMASKARLESLESQRRLDIIQARIVAEAEMNRPLSKRELLKRKVQALSLDQLVEILLSKGVIEEADLP